MALTDITPGPAEDEISRLLRTSSLVPLTIAASPINGTRLILTLLSGTESTQR